MTKRVHVVGAVIIRDGLVLCARRGPDGDLPGHWEFPGGKVEDGESPTAALAREIHEELDCRIEVGGEVTTTTHDYEFATVTLATFYCRLVAGAPRATEHEAIAWLPPAELGTLTWAPADVPAVELLQETLPEKEFE
jgi:8-oxo-dGTP diphosphatase